MIQDITPHKLNNQYGDNVKNENTFRKRNFQLGESRDEATLNFKEKL